MTIITPHLSPTLAANEKVLQLRAQGRQIFHMGFGQAPFPAHPRLVEVLQRHATVKDYLPVAGIPALHDAVVNHQARLTGINPEDYHVIVAPGSKLILFALQMAMSGDIMLPVPSWVSYAPQASLLSQNVVPVPTSISADGLTLDPDKLQHAYDSAKQQGLKPTKLLINFPGNPTGVTITDDALTQTAEFCRRNSVTLISDEIYGRLSFDRQYRTASTHFPEGAIVTSGLSKHLSLGGWRLGIGLVPKAMTELITSLNHIASETWSCVSAPVQYAAVEAYQGHADVEEFVEQSVTIHEIVNTYIAQRLNAMGIACPTPQGAFYTWPDMQNSIKTHTFSSSTALADYLLERHAIVTLPGSAFGETDASCRLRLSGCDYDGQAALELLRQVGRNELAQQLPTLAPNVCGALDAFEQFARES